ncbi:unnamed protein product [Symbiodinium sp. CCMP2592]|nr:unnamed protein product [Symbiodinium sp. CCMP2592]
MPNCRHRDAIAGSRGRWSTAALQLGQLPWRRAHCTRQDRGVNAAQHRKTASSAWGWEEGACRQTGHAATGGKANSGETRRGGVKKAGGQLFGRAVLRSGRAR